MQWWHNRPQVHSAYLPNEWSMLLAHAICQHPKPVAKQRRPAQRGACL